MPSQSTPRLRRTLRLLANLWPGPFRPRNGDATVIALARRRDELRRLAETLRGEVDLAEIGEVIEQLAGEIARQPTSSIAVAHLKLRIVAEDYIALTVDGYDLRLLHQVLAWMSRETGGS